MAAGGEVKNYCDEDRPHRLDCKYFAAGGSVNALDIPQHADPAYSVASYLVHSGVHSLLKDGPEQSQLALDRYNSSVNRGHKLFDSHVESLFGGKEPPQQDHSKAKKDLDDWVSKGGVNHEIQNEFYKQGEAPATFAKGGKVEESPGIVHKNHIAEAYPEHNVMLQESKARISNYLNNLKPQTNQPKLAFDDEPDNRQQKKSYASALHIAAHPMSILEDVRKGTIEPEQVGHFKAMHPGIDDAVQKKLTKRIVEDQMEKKKPSYRVRQGLSLLMGAPLSGELSPQNIMAAQATFQGKKAAQQEGGQPQKKTSAIAKSSQSYLLPNQAAAERQQKQ